MHELSYDNFVFKLEKWVSWKLVWIRYVYLSVNLCQCVHLSGHLSNGHTDRQTGLSISLYVCMTEWVCMQGTILCSIQGSKARYIFCCKIQCHSAVKQPLYFREQKPAHTYLIWAGGCGQLNVRWTGRNCFLCGMIHMIFKTFIKASLLRKKVPCKSKFVGLSLHQYKSSTKLSEGGGGGSGSFNFRPREGGLRRLYT